MELVTMKIPQGVNVMEDGKPFFFEGGKTGCLLIHGFTGTTSSMKPMGEFLAGKGLTVLGPRLPGHGTDVKDMARWAYTDWTGTAETALKELSSMCDKVFVGGLSMGGTLTLYLAEKFTDKISGIIPINAPVKRLIISPVQNQLLKAVPVVKHILKTFPGVGSDVKDPDVTEVAYDKLSTNAVQELVKLQAIVMQGLGRITIPVRIFESKDDHVVPPLNGPFIFENIKSSDKKLTWLENSYHVATIDLDKEKIWSESFNFINGIAG